MGLRGAKSGVPRAVKDGGREKEKQIPPCGREDRDGARCGRRAGDSWGIV